MNEETLNKLDQRQCTGDLALKLDLSFSTVHVDLKRIVKYCKERIWVYSVFTLENRTRRSVIFQTGILTFRFSIALL